MSYQISPTDPVVAFDAGALEKQVATFAKANGITTQAAWATFIASINTNAQAVAVCKGLLTAFTLSASV
jgi:hypothetical protein